MQDEITTIKSLEEIGVQNVLKETQEYKERKLEIEKLIVWKDSSKKENELLREKLFELKDDIHIRKKKLEDRVLEQKLYQMREEYDKFDKEIYSIKEQLEGFKVSKQNLIEKGKKHKDIIDKLNSVDLPENLDDLQISKVSDLMQILELESINRLNNLQNQYAELKEKRNRYQKRLSETEQNQKELEKICSAGREYLNRHMQVKSCPLCHTPFESWKELFDNVNGVESENFEFFQKEMQEISLSLSEKSDEYATEYRNFLEVKLKKIDNKKIDLREIENNINELEKIILKKSEIVQYKEAEISSYKQLLINEEVSLYDSIDQAIIIWKQNKQKRIDSKISELKQLEQLEREVVINEEKLTTLQKKQLNAKANSELFEGITFLLDKHQEYSVEAEKERINNILLRIQKERDVIQEEISKLNYISDIELNYFIELKDKQKKLFDKESIITSQCDIFPELSDIAIKESLIKWEEKNKKDRKSIELLYQICTENGMRAYLEKYKSSKKKLEIKEEEKEKVELEKHAYKVLYDKTKKELEEGLKIYFSQSFINEIYQKIDPHYIMKNIDYNISFNEDNKPQLYMQVKESQENEDGDAYRPEWFFSSAQLNTVVFSSFFSRALQAKSLPIGTIFIDDPIEYFDDINMLGFADLLRSVLELSNCQIIISTHDERVFRILERKLDNKFYSSCFIRLPDDYRVPSKL